MEEMVLVCPKCTKNNKLTAKFCCICAAKLEGVAPQPAPLRVTCTSCGSVNKPGAKFCYKCATSLVEVPKPDRESESVPTPCVCPDGHSNKPGAKFCKICGKPVSGAASIPVTEGKACACGHVNKPTSKFCAKCGRDLAGKADGGPIDGFWYIL